MDDDALLLRRLADGDRSAFEAIVRRHVDFVYATARRRVNGDAHLAEDVAQAVFIVLLQKAPAIAGRAVLVGWLYRTVGHVASNANKLKRRRAHYERAAAAERTEHAMPDDAAPEEETLRQLDAALGTLRPQSRDAILLRFFRRQTFAEVGRALGISDEAAKKRVTRALSELRGTLAGAASAGAVVALLEAMPSSASAAAPAALTQSILNTHAPPAAAAALAKGTLVAMTTKKLTIAAAAVAALLLGGAAVAVLTSGPDAPLAATTAPAADRSGRLVAALPDGSIELIAVGDVDGARWWTPSGGAEVPRPFERFPGGVTAEDGKILRCFVYRFDTKANENGPLTRDASIAGSSASVTATIDRADGAAEPLMAKLAGLPPDGPATLRFRVATGPWQTVAAAEPAATTRPTSDPDVLLEPLVALPADRGGGVEVRLRIDTADDQRVVVTDRAGRDHVASSSSIRPRIRNPGLGEASWDAAYGVRKLSVEDVAKIRVERRPFNHTVEFRDLATNREAPTTPRVVVDGE